MVTAGAKDLRRIAERKGSGLPPPARLSGKIVLRLRGTEKANKKRSARPIAGGVSLITVLPDQLLIPRMTANGKINSRGGAGELERCLLTGFRNVREIVKHIAV
jgi:hypothetical protein